MNRYSFTTTKINASSFLTNFFSDVDVEIQLDEDDNFITLKDESKRVKFLNLIDSLGKEAGFSQPYFIPDWKNIDHKGPFLHSYNQTIYHNSKLIHKITKREIFLSPENEEIAFLFSKETRSAADEVFRDNFWTEFKSQVQGIDVTDKINDFDWSDVDEKASLPNTETVNKSEYGKVLIDGTTYLTSPFSANGYDLVTGENNPNRGKIIPPIQIGDVTINLSPEYHEAGNFNMVYKPGVRWAAFWKTKYSTKRTYMNIVFIPVENEEVFEEIPESDSESVLSSFEQENDDTSVTDKKRSFENLPDTIDLETRDIDFNSPYLPLNYFTSKHDQLLIVLQACQSNFRNVKNLKMVNDEIIKSVSLLAKSGLKKSKRPEVNKAFIDYAKKRKIKLI